MQKSLLIVAAIMYFIPLCKFLFYLFRKLLSFFGSETCAFLSKISHPQSQDKPHVVHQFIFCIASIEYYVQMLRFYFVGVPIVCWWGGASLMLFCDKSIMPSYLYVLLLLCSLLVIWHHKQKKISDIRVSQFVKLFPDIHPITFFRRYKCEIAFGGVDLFQCDPCDFMSLDQARFRQGGRSSQKRTVVFRGLVDTAYIAHFCLTGLKYLGPVYLQSFVDHIANLWGKRLLQLTNSDLLVSGTDKLKGKKGRFLLIFNHKSALDFVLTSYALSQIEVNGRFIKPRFILAQDHFKDNWFIYHLLGIGKVAEAMDMIFVSRKDQKKSFESLRKAARVMIEKDVDVAIYPQGTRAEGNFDRALKRRDAGFYTTIRKKDIKLKNSHLKRGTAFLIIDTLAALREQNLEEELHLVFIGINGTATTLPKGSLKVQTETEIQFTIGDVITLSPRLLDEVLSDSLAQEERAKAKKNFVSDLCLLINDKLTQVLDLPAQLIQRYLTELKGQFRYDQEKIAIIKERLYHLDEESDIIYQILDRIYSLPIPQWNGYLSQLGQLLMDRTTQDRFQVLLEEVSEELLKKKKK